MVAAVFRVLVLKIWEGPRIDPAYVESIYEDELSPRWSGNPRSAPALLSDSATSVKPAQTSKAPEAPPSAPVAKDTPAPAAPATATAPEPSPDSVPAAIPVAPPAPASAQEPAAKPTIAQPPASSLTDIETKRLAITAAAQAFFTARSTKEKLRYARDPDRIRPLMEHYYRTHDFPTLEWKGLGWLVPVSEPGYRLGYAQALFSNAEPLTLIVEETDSGDFHIDWESSVHYSELPWQDYLSKRPEEPTLMRVVASRPATLPKGKELGNTVLELRHPGETGSLYAYFDRNDSRYSYLMEQLQLGKWQDVPLTLRLQHPTAADNPRKVRIAGVEGKGWLILENRRS